MGNVEQLMELVRFMRDKLDMNYQFEKLLQNSAIELSEDEYEEVEEEIQEEEQPEQEKPKQPIQKEEMKQQETAKDENRRSRDSLTMVAEEGKTLTKTTSIEKAKLLTKDEAKEAVQQKWRNLQKDVEKVKKKKN